MIQHFTYITRDRNSDRYYVGRHSAKRLNDGYTGSGKWVIAARRAGRDLICQPLQFFESLDDLIQAEGRLLKEHFGQPGCMNFSKSPNGKAVGSIGYRPKGLTPWNNGKTKNDCTIVKRIGEKNSVLRAGHTPWNKGKRYKQTKPPTQERKRKIAAAVSEQWRITFPDGRQEIITNLNNFAREHGLCIPHNARDGRCRVGKRSGHGAGYLVQKAAS